MLIGIACLAMVIALYMCCYSAWAAWREANAARTEMDEARLLRLQRAVDAVHTCEHPMVVFSLESLRRFGRLPPHEAVRGDLIFLDNYDDVVEFAAAHPTSRSSPRPKLDRLLTSRSFHTLQSSALDKLRRHKRGECKGDTSGKSDWCRKTVFPELYFGGLVEALEEHMANGDLVFPDGK